MQGIFQKENTDKALKYGIYRHLPTYEKIIRNLVSFYVSTMPEVDDQENMKWISVLKKLNLDTFEATQLDSVECKDAL